MALADLTDRSAVLAAIAEYEELGRDGFLAKYGFSRARSYFLRDGERRYDSKAIVGAAHGHQHGEPLRSNEFSGGEATVAAKLESLGFDVQRPEQWRIPPDAEVTRAEVQAEYGGALYGGIQPSRTTPNVLIYSDPAEGVANGYNFDGWDPSNDRVFHYTGEGRDGPQQMRVGNKAILDHAQDGRTLRLFEAIDGKQRSGGKVHRYLGAFEVDPSMPYRQEVAPDASGNARSVFVFRLVRVDSHPDRRVDTSAARAARPPVPAEIELVDSENNTTTEFQTQPRAGTTAIREEARLVRRFETQLRRKGHDLKRIRIPIPGERTTLVTDTYDVTAKVLYEAKSGVDRSTIRLGVGQLLDYLRFADGASGCLLLPRKPSDDLRRFIRSCELGLVYSELRSWVWDEQLEGGE